MQQTLTNVTLGPTDYRRFGLSLAVALAVVFGLFFPWLLENPWPRWPWVGAAMLIVWACCLPMTLRWLYRPWMWLGSWLGAINTRIILSLMFYLLLTPIALAMKLAGRDPLQRKPDPAARSYWRSSRTADREHVTRIY